MCQMLTDVCIECGNSYEYESNNTNECYEFNTCVECWNAYFADYYHDAMDSKVEASVVRVGEAWKCTCKEDYWCDECQINDKYFDGFPE